MQYALAGQHVARRLQLDPANVQPLRLLGQMVVVRYADRTDSGDLSLGLVRVPANQLQSGVEIRRVHIGRLIRGYGGGAHGSLPRVASFARSRNGLDSRSKPATS